LTEVAERVSMKGAPRDSWRYKVIRPESVPATVLATMNSQNSKGLGEIGAAIQAFFSRADRAAERVLTAMAEVSANLHEQAEVLHGRILGYDSRRRAAQAFAFLAGCMEILVSSREKTPMTVRSVYMTGGTSATNRFLLAFEETEKSAVERAVDELKAKRESRADD
jgi:hypothetical protein